MLSVLPSVLVLGLAALAAATLAWTRSSPPEWASKRRVTAQTLALATAVQAIHFTEEAITDFPRRLGELLGLPAMPMSFFMVFNLAWIGIWLASIVAIRAAHRWAFFAAWFLAIAGMFNGIAHPMLAAASVGYFPGLWTSPAIALAGLWLASKLREATRSR